ncbi:hypothetical protein [Flavobacterium sp. LC2016-01]|uniref:hypothetical protein n=1 Tax=Flavobacterium sp. LC2016-01 TaxID=2675876 RepID=UPI0012BA6A49|nr:hypothetical protein [Flavobacterium sp. LC2016-01]MTH16213.1 hypothetical protein [Flavobacterium sp. LC2016-01]
MIEEIESVKTSIKNINNEFKNKLRLPIIITYSVVLFLYNWDILFYLAFEKDNALNKIEYVKNNFFTVNFERIWKPIFIATLYSILFPFIQVLINKILQFFKRYNNKITREEEIENANHNFNIQQQLTGKQSLQQLQNKIDQLILEKDELIATNNSLISQIRSENIEYLDSKQIQNSEYEKTAKEFFKDVNKLGNEEKSTFIELISLIDELNNATVSSDEIMKKLIFPQHFKRALGILIKYNLIEKNEYSDDYFKTNTLGLKIIKYFKSKYVK